MRVAVEVQLLEDLEARADLQLGDRLRKCLKARVPYP
ncbi:hypothetical protein TIFTF001_002095 [Ficus carica]|uniref:Uncharacterized protein n=1 Tax=Ficus carica TaxID=3494 RepID=A0AA87Z2U9_FICCA|nr:hypothetical protein TIFTF001_002095 [Ficus carica]